MRGKGEEEWYGETRERRDTASFFSLTVPNLFPQEERNLTGGRLKPKQESSCRIARPGPAAGLQTCENKITPNFRSNCSELGGGGARESRKSRGTGDSGPSRNHRRPYPWRAPRGGVRKARSARPGVLLFLPSKCCPSIIQQRAMTSSPSDIARDPPPPFVSRDCRIVESPRHRRDCEKWPAERNNRPDYPNG